MTEVFAVNSPRRAVLDVVFVHGLDGDARKTWSREEPESFWPRWLADDVDDAAISTVGYDAWSSRWRGRSMSLPDRAINILAQLQNHGIGGRPLCVVTHSMGGLLVKEMLLHAAGGGTGFASFATAIKGVVFLSTPHTGAGITKAVEALGVVYQGTPAVDDLKRNSPYLRQLDDRYRDWVDAVKIRNLVFFETHRTKGVRVVDESSANPGLPRVKPIPVDANHIDICKPTSRTSLVYGQIKRFVTDIRASLGQSDDSTAQDVPPQVIEHGAAGGLVPQYICYVARDRLNSLYHQIDLATLEDSREHALDTLTFGHPDAATENPRSARATVSRLTAVLEHLDRNALVGDLATVLSERGLLSHEWYAVSTSFQVSGWDPASPNVYLEGQVADYRVRLSCTKGDFSGLGREDGTFIPTSTNRFLFEERVALPMQGLVRLAAAERGLLRGSPLYLVLNPLRIDLGEYNDVVL